MFGMLNQANFIFEVKGKTTENNVKQAGADFCRMK